MKRKNPNSFSDWIKSVGVNTVARELNVTAHTVRNWRKGFCAPQAHHMVKLVKMSGGALKYETIVRGVAR